MSNESMLPYYTAASGRATGMFNTSMGELQRQLYQGEYDPFKYAPMFESAFIQISKRGEVIDVHNRVRMVTVGIASTSPVLPLPNVMLLARPIVTSDDQHPPSRFKHRKSAKTLELTRLLPLKFVKISIHDSDKQQLRLKLASGRSFYLQLCPPSDAREDLFAYWVKLIYLLRPPLEVYSSTQGGPVGDTIEVPMLTTEEKRNEEIIEPLFDSQDDLSYGPGNEDRVSLRSLHMFPEATRREEVHELDVVSSDAPSMAGEEGSLHQPFEEPSQKRPTTLQKSPTLSSPKAGKAGKPRQETWAEPSSSLLGSPGRGMGETLRYEKSSELQRSDVYSLEEDGAIKSPSSLKSQGSARERERPIVSSLKSDGYMSERDGSQKRSPHLSQRFRSDEQSAVYSQGPKGQKEASQKSSRTSEGKLSQKSSSRSKRSQSREASRNTSSHKGSSRSPSAHKGSSRSPSARKSSSHSPSAHKSSSHSPSAHKSTSRDPSSKESKSSHKSGKSKSTKSSDHLSKKPSKIGSFIRSFSKSSQPSRKESQLSSRESRNLKKEKSRSQN
ncbi:LOW QUALITY PROTEIN: protein FAM71A-like [Tachyglossus aculeatus]|uniref:LOW QUALITY PROTEIN: protein FAM71A-like n=1 Tax=Tachyglossus aculeatus TaxID=9261 RepID=UPI0018F4BF03|nr:LOW QUALITY PROTEIN: protein FAM71A-like [Tachyglossus aculeatus]